MKQTKLIKIKIHLYNLVIYEINKVNLLILYKMEAIYIIDIKKR